jgi:hypothetical protein
MKDGAHERRRDAAKKAELDAERALMDALEALTLPTSSPLDTDVGLAQELFALIDAWNGSKAVTLACTLAARLT